MAYVHFTFQFSGCCFLPNCSTPLHSTNARMFLAFVCRTGPIKWIIPCDRAKPHTQLICRQAGHRSWELQAKNRNRNTYSSNPLFSREQKKCVCAVNCSYRRSISNDMNKYSFLLVTTLSIPMKTERNYNSFVCNMNLACADRPRFSLLFPSERDNSLRSKRQKKKQE